MEAIDILGNKLKEGDYVLWTRPQGYASLLASPIEKITSSNVILKKGPNTYWRRVCNDPESELMKITEEEYEYINKI